MSEDTTAIGRDALEKLLGPNEWVKYCSKDEAGFESEQARTSYLRNAFHRVYGKMNTEERLQNHSDRVIKKIESILNEKKGLKRAKFMENQLVGLMKETGYLGDAAKPPEDAYVTDKKSGKRLKQDYIRGFIKYVKENFGKSPDGYKALEKENTQLKTKLADLETRLGAFLGELNQELDTD
jgi:hypothetical protein